MTDTEEASQPGIESSGDLSKAKEGDSALENTTQNLNTEQRPPITMERWNELKSSENPNNEEFADIREVSNRRVDVVMSKSMKPEDILKDIYGHSEDEMSPMTPAQREQLARAHIAQDLLTISLYNSDGSESDLMEAIKDRYPGQIDPTDYKPITKSWNATKQILEISTRKPSAQEKRLSEYAGHVATQEEENRIEEIRDPVEKYVILNTPEGGSPAAIAIPYEINAYSQISIRSTQGDFVEPWGGSMADRIVFVTK